MTSRKHPGIGRLFAGHAVLTASVFGFAAATAATPPAQGAPQPVEDAWLDGRLETVYALNEHLAPFGLAVDVANGVVEVSGSVETEIERDLALEIARSVDGVREVKSALVVDGAKPPAPIEEGGTRSFRQRIADATATARVKRSLAANGNTRNLAIEVATENDVVTLKGAVISRKHKMLAEMIARNTDGIASVRNELEITEPLET